MNRSAVIFGGTGFIGTFFATFLLDSKMVEKVYLVDLMPIASKRQKFRHDLISRLGGIQEVILDVRHPITWLPDENVVLIANFAAIHREPGHQPQEYFETNLRGAHNVCCWASLVGCHSIIFTSSISPYGVSEASKTETTLPCPVTPYGSSKLVAEKIHEAWLAEDASNRHLVIVRPGVVFGPGEGGNVTRLIRAVLHRYFVYVGNRETRKAGTYVKELCHAMLWVLELQREKDEHYSLFNMSMNPGPSIQDYVRTTCKVAGVSRFVPSVPYQLLLGAAYIIDALLRPTGVSHPFSPVRIRKLVRSNNVIPQFLLDHKYPWQYSLEEAFADWKSVAPEDWQ